VEFQLLGRMEVLHEGAAVTPGRRQERCLLGLLLLEANTTVPVERLVDLLWDDAPPLRARATIHTYISRLRAALDPGGDGRCGLRLVRSGDGYQAQVDAGTVDALRLRCLAERARDVADPAQRARLLRDALGAWRGLPLADDASERLRSRLAPAWQELRLAALEAAIEAELACGRHAELVGELGGLLAEHPLREHLTGLLMLALYRAGRQAEALAAYQNTRRILVDHLGAEPGPDLRQLHQRILAGDADLLATPASDTRAAPVPAAVAVTPRQLPAAARHFTGRQSEVDMLAGLLEDAAGAGGTVVISAIGGMAGVGKTSLAVWWAHRVSDQFVDGQLFVNLRGFAPSGAAPVTPVEALRGFLDAFGVPPERIPAGLDAQAGLYRSLVAGKRLLIVLDNARDEQQVRPLLPGAPGCLVVVTSRHRLTGLVTRDGAAPLALDVLTHAEAQDLLARRLGTDRIDREPDAVADIIALCARLPLALAIVAARAADQPRLDLEILAAQLRNRRDRLNALDSDSDEDTSLRAVFSWSYQVLDPDTARAFRLLGLHPGADISLPAASALIDRPESQTRQLLNQLAAVHLLELRDPDRYQFHDLLHSYAAEVAGHDDSGPARDTALCRVLGWYLHATAAADRCLNYHDHRAQPDPRYQPTRAPSFASHTEADTWLATERATIVAAVRTAGEHRLNTLTWQLAAFTWNHLYRHRHLDDWLATHRIGLEAARRSNDRDGQARILNLLGLCHRQRGDLDAAIACYEQSLSLARAAQHQRRQYIALDNLALAYLAAGRAQQALRCFDEALHLVEQTDDRSGAATVLCNLGETYRRLQRTDDALACLQRGQTIARALGDPVEAFILNALEELHLDLGQYEQAAEYCRHGLTIARQSNHRVLIATFQDHLGTALSATGDLDAARHAWHEARTIYLELGLPAAETIRSKLAALNSTS
jgi:DNA-binding SARP family transcriptional activator/tetratricopeptide (TPR) repeat protein